MRSDSREITGAIVLHGGNASVTVRAAETAAPVVSLGVLRPIVVLAVDPGPLRWGWAIIVIVFTPRGISLRWVAGDHEVWSVALHLRLLDRANDEALRHDADVLVASEIVTGKVYEGRSHANILDTSRACGRATPVAELLDLLRRQGRLVTDRPCASIGTAEYTTHQWHGVLTRHESAPQEAINEVVRAVVKDLPALPKSRDGIPYAEHILDAAGIAIAAGLIARGVMVVPLPATVVMLIERLMSEERTKRAAKREKKKLAVLEAGGDPRAPRMVSRAERGRRSTSAKFAAARRA